MTRPTGAKRYALSPKPAPRKLSLKSLVARSVYFAYVNAQEAMQRDQQRQDDQAALLHQDIQANWDHSVTALQTTGLADQSQDGAGTGLDPGGSTLPPEFLQAPQ